MAPLLVKTLFAFATGMVGGYVHHALGMPWGLALLGGYALGFWLWNYLQ